MYFEEKDFCKRGEKIGLYSYQITSIRVKKLGRSVITTNKEQELKLSNLTSWHFIWSKYYYYNKHYGNLFSIIYFQPILIRCIFKLIFFYLIKKKIKLEKYKYRFDGLLKSIIKKKSFLRIKQIQ